MDERMYNLFENCVARIFQKVGYDIKQNIYIEPGHREIDILAEKNMKKYYVEVKSSQITKKTIIKLNFEAKNDGVIPVIVTARYVEKEKRDDWIKEYPELIIVDISNLLFAVQDDTELHNELLAVLPYVVEGIEPEEGFLKIDCLQHDDYTNSLIREMELCVAGRPMARNYEELCHDLLINVFSEDLTLWNKQQRSNNDLYRFDLLCRIKDDNKKTFWTILERYFNSKYVVFEFKNYKKPVSQKEIYTTEKYLYAKALRSVGIIIAANGYEDNARWAAKGCLRENGKLIVLLETKDLIEMNNMKIRQDDPSEHLQEILDKMLINLEK